MITGFFPLVRYSCFKTGYSFSRELSLFSHLLAYWPRIEIWRERNVSPIIPSGPYPVIDSCGSIRSDGTIAKKLQLRKDELIISPSSPISKHRYGDLARKVVRCALFKAMFSLPHMKVGRSRSLTLNACESHPILLTSLGLTYEGCVGIFNRKHPIRKKENS